MENIIYNEYLTDKFNCNYIKLYIPSSLRNKDDLYFHVLQYFIFNNLKDSIPEYNNIRISIKHNKFGRYNICVVELVFSGEICKNDMFNYIKNILSVFNHKVKMNKNYNFKDYVRKAEESIKEELSNNYVYSQQIIDNLIYADIHDKTLLEEDFHGSLIELLKGNIYFLYLGKEENSLREFFLEKVEKTYNYESNNNKLKKDKIIIDRKSSVSIFMVVYYIKFIPEKYICYRAFSLFFSLLLQKYVRGEEALAYYTGSEFDNISSRFYVRIGTRYKNHEEVRRIVFNILEKIKNGDFSDELIEQVILCKINEIINMQDDPFMMISFIFENTFLKQSYNIEEIIGILQSMTRNDFQNIAWNLEKELELSVIGRED